MRRRGHDIVGGQIAMGYMSVAAATLIRGGRLRPIAVTFKVRVPALPDVPTLSETLALADYELDNWFGLFAPAAVPKPIITTLNAAAVQVLGTPAMQKTIVDGGGMPAPGTPEAFAAFIAAQSRIYAQIIKEVGITPWRMKARASSRTASRNVPPMWTSCTCWDSDFRSIAAARCTMRIRWACGMWPARSSGSPGNPCRTRHSGSLHRCLRSWPQTARHSTEEPGGLP